MADGLTSGVDLKLAAVVAIGASAVAVLVGLSPALPPSLREALVPEAGLGLVLVIQVLVLSVVFPLRISRLASVPAPQVLLEALSVGLASLPFVVGVAAMLDSPVASAVAVVGFLILLAVSVTMFSLMVGWSLRSSAAAWRRVGRSAPALLAAVVFVLVGPLPVLLGARDDLQPGAPSRGFWIPSPCQAAYARASRLGRISGSPRGGAGSASHGRSSPVAGMSVVGVSGPPGQVFRPGVPFIMGLVVQLDQPSSGVIAVRSGGLESGVAVQAPSGGRLAVTIPVVLGRAGYESASVVWRDQGDPSTVVSLGWPEGRSALLAADDATAVVGCVGPGSRRVAAEIATSGSPVRLVELDEALVLESSEILAEVFDAIVVTRVERPGRVVKSLTLYAAAGGVALFREPPAEELDLGSVPLPGFPGVVSVAAGGMGVLSSETVVGSWSGFDARVRRRQQRSAGRRTLCAEAGASLVTEYVPGWGIRDLTWSCSLAQAALAFGMLSMGVVLRRIQGSMTTGLGAVVALVLGCSLPAWMAAPISHVQTATVTVFSSAAGRARARRDEAVVVWSFGRETRHWSRPLPGPLPWIPSSPLARGWIERYEPARTWTGDSGRWLQLDVAIGRPLTLARSGVSETAGVIDVRRAADGAMEITSGLEATLHGSLLVSSRGVIPIGDLTPGVIHRVSAEADQLPLAVHRGRLGLASQQRLRMIGPWLHSARATSRPVLVGFTAGWPDKRPEASPGSHRVEALVVSLP